MRIYGCLKTVASLLLAGSWLAGAAAADSLTLAQAVGQALASNPTIASGKLSASAARESARGARALANPEILVAPSVVGKAGADSAALFSQPLEINGSRKARGRIAEGEAAAASYSSLVVEREVVLKVKQLYWDTARAQEIVKLHEDNLSYLESLDKAIRKQVEVGKAPGSQAIKSDVELARARQELAQAQLDLRNSAAALAVVLARPADTQINAADPLVRRNISLDRQNLVATAVTSRPEVLALAAEMGAAQGRVSSARAKRIPDLALQARKESFDDGESGVAISVTLPLLDWGSARAEKRSAEIEHASKAKQLEAARNDVALDVERAVKAVDTAQTIISEYDSGILDKSVELAAMAEKGYEKGALNYLDVLEAQRTLRSVRNAYLSALADHAKAVAQVEWAVGCELPYSTTPEVKN